MDKEKIYFTVGIVAFQCGACMIHWGLGLMLLGAWLLLGSFIEFEKNQEDEDDESDTFELPTNAPQGAIWPFDGKNYIRINDTWVQLTDDLISDKRP